MPSMCYVRRILAWLTYDQIKSHEETNNFYLNPLACAFINSNGTKVTLDNYEPDDFSFLN